MRKKGLLIPLAIGEIIQRVRNRTNTRNPYSFEPSALEAKVISALNARFQHHRGMNVGASSEITPGLTPQQLEQLVNGNYANVNTGNAPKPRIVLNQNPVFIGTSPVQLAQSYTSRAMLRITNTGNTNIFIGFGFSPTGVNYTHALSACSAIDDGTGGFITDADWKGNVWAISSAAGGKVNFFEEP